MWQTTENLELSYLAWGQSILGPIWAQNINSCNNIIVLCEHHFSFNLMTYGSDVLT